MKALPQILLWLGIISIPGAWAFWYFGPEIEIARSVLTGIQDPAVKAALQEAHAERWGLFVGIWPVTLMALSMIAKKRAED